MCLPATSSGAVPTLSGERCYTRRRHGRRDVLRCMVRGGGRNLHEERWNGRVILTLARVYTALEGPIADLRQCWLGRSCSRPRWISNSFPRRNESDVLIKRRILPRDHFLWSMTRLLKGVDTMKIRPVCVCLNDASFGRKRHTPKFGDARTSVSGQTKTILLIRALT
ncbi:hypothetical protein QBC46DRAFT_159642 [Diplogelasinospora grovesii]|uniref:Uncharacterized protein n=1 Tax=Diplogelasinospora grovesii TaxID=303347 RepID=A0AAN6N475_9PEZI|nr:hypothetical protein QBC46DRAFT_159642 [Diplogelasinospora grovesii]